MSSFRRPIFQQSYCGLQKMWVSEQIRSFLLPICSLRISFGSTACHKSRRAGNTINCTSFPQFSDLEQLLWTASNLSRLSKVALDPQTHARAIDLESPDSRCGEEKAPKTLLVRMTHKRIYQPMCTHNVPFQNPKPLGCKDWNCLQFQNIQVMQHCRRTWTLMSWKSAKVSIHKLFSSSLKGSFRTRKVFTCRGQHEV